MKKLFTIALILTSLTVYGQSFEGKVIYQNSYKSKIPNVPDGQFNAMMGTKQEYYIKQGDYKHVADGTFFQWLLYNKSDNKLYTKMANSETIYWNDGKVNNDSIYSFEINKGVKEILGYQCDELILNCKSGIQKYYYNAKLAVDKKLYENHKYGNWFDFLKHSNSLPLQVVIENEQFVLESTAVEITPMKLDDQVFQLAKNTKLEKSPY